MILKLYFILAAESETTTIPETTPIGSTNQSPGYQATTGTLPSFITSDQNLRFNQNKLHFILVTYF
jgi:hypothetical protein